MDKVDYVRRTNNMDGLYYVFNGKRFQELDELVGYYNHMMGVGDTPVMANIMYNDAKVGQIDIDRTCAEGRRETGT